MATALISAAFLEELEKIAGVYKGVAGVEDKLRSDIPLVKLRKSLSHEAKLQRISRAIDRSKAAVLGHANVAVRADELSLKGMGFKPTRLAVKPPGQRGVLPVSYRKGRVHGHPMGGLVLLHHDKTAPQGLEAVRHAVTEGLPALAKRMKRGVVPPVQFSRG